MSKPEDNDIFIKNSIYPEAGGVFSFKPKSLKDIKDNCLVVLDTNVLLIPYTTGKNSLKAIRNIYEKLTEKNRLIIPGQVAREFADNRVNKIKELFSQVNRKKLNFGLGSYPLLEENEDYIKAHDIEGKIKELIVDYNKNINNILNSISDWYWNDPVSLLYGELFVANVVNDPILNKEAIKARLDSDMKYKLPPGYKDAGKTDEGIGDLLIWLTILEVVKTNNQSVIFVSHDAKTDWISKSEGSTLFPRFELIDEFRRESKGHSFHVLKFSNFLELFGAKDEVVEEVRKEEVTNFLKLGSSTEGIVVQNDIQAESAVWKYLMNLYPTHTINFNEDEYFNYIIEIDENSKIGVIIKYTFGNTISPNILKRDIGLMLKYRFNDTYKQIFLFLVRGQRIPPKNDMLEFIVETQQKDPKIKVFIGYLDQGDNLYIDYQF